MKVVIFTLLFILLAVANGKRCSEDGDCGEDECCINRGILGFRKGDCKPLSKEGQSCSDREDMLFNNRHMMYCPCSGSLICEPEEVKDLPFVGKIKINERCVSEPSTNNPVTEPPEPQTEAPAEE